MTLIDMQPATCQCKHECEWPCWQRVGLTDQACCPGCEPLPDPRCHDQITGLPSGEAS